MSAEPAGETRPAAQGPGAPGKTVIVGSRGRMGAMLLARAREAGLAVGGVDQPLTPRALETALAGADLALLCVPAAVFEEVARAVTARLAPGAVLADITSVKERPLRQMEGLWPGPVVGTHPLFGPKPAPGADQPVAVVAGKGAEEAHLARVEGFFSALGCRTFRCSAATHDRAMARIQNTNFITNLAYFALLAGEEELLPFLTPSFERRKAAAAKMLTEDAELFGGLFEANAHSHEAVRQYRKMLNVAAGGDIDLLCHRAAWWWDGGAEAALARRADGAAETENGEVTPQAAGKA
ncbi:MAG: prephenate dehydrogenase [Desulfovibrio sp.]|nr:prephenate dehydrogenase [Desulfovibrio sp.]